jgi:hypothetical protein
MVRLPTANLTRWTPRRKAAVVLAIADGQLLREEACRRYQLSEEELLAWEQAFKVFGNLGLHATRLQQYRCHPVQLTNAVHDRPLTRIR